MKISGFIIIAVLICMATNVCAETSGAGSGSWSGGGGASQSVAVAVAPQLPVPVPTTPLGGEITGNYTRIEISPAYMNFRLQPGESRDMTLTVRNRDTREVQVTPEVQNLPYPNMLEPSWVAFAPGIADVPAGGSMKINVKVAVPSDATPGFYNAQVAITDETYPMPYREPVPSYIHSMSLAVEVYTPPVILIRTPYIGGGVEAGREYDYGVEIENIGDHPVSIDPILGIENYPVYGPYGISASPLTEDAFSLSGAETILPGATGLVKLHLRVPSDAKGSYSGYIDLQIDDPSVREGEGRISMNFMIWQQPDEPFVRSFVMQDEGTVTIELSAWTESAMFPGSLAMASGGSAEPVFEALLEGPDGRVDMQREKQVIRGSVSMGGDIPPYLSGKENSYQESGVQYTETYSASGKVGPWKLLVMPRNMQRFEYIITMGGNPVSVPENRPVVDVSTVAAPGNSSG